MKLLKKLHHVAYRCLDADQTAKFYTELLGLRLVASLVQEEVPSLRREEPHNHIFFELDDGSYIAFFDILGDNGSPIAIEGDWAQHLALEIENMDVGNEVSRRLKNAGVDVVGPVDHGMCTSWYFRDPSDHRLELSVRTEGPGFWERAASQATANLAAWQSRKTEEGAHQ